MLLLSYAASTLQEACVGWLEVLMRRLAAVVYLVLIAASAEAQTNLQAITLAGLSDCIKDSIGAGAVELNGDALVFSCSAAKARTLYNFLGRKVRSEVVLDRNGKFENRAFGSNACYHQVEDQSGKATDDYRCDLIMPVGDALGD
jgi:hypothetical protein